MHIVQGLPGFKSFLPSAADVEVMENCCKAQEEYISEIAIPIESDDDLSAFLNAEAVKSNDVDDKGVGTSHHLGIGDEEGESADQDVPDTFATEENLIKQFVRKPRSQPSRAPKKTTATSSVAVSESDDEEFMKLLILKRGSTCSGSHD